MIRFKFADIVSWQIGDGGVGVIGLLLLFFVLFFCWLLNDLLDYRCSVSLKQGYEGYERG